MSFMSKFITNSGSSNSSSISNLNLRHTYQHKLTRWMMFAHSDYREQVLQFLLFYFLLPWTYLEAIKKGPEGPLFVSFHKLMKNVHVNPFGFFFTSETLLITRFCQKCFWNPNNFCTTRWCFRDPFNFVN